MCNQYIISEVMKRYETKFEKVPEKYFDDETVISEAYVDVKLPRRATQYSAGYDFYIPYSCKIYPGESRIIDTYVRCRIHPNYFLALVPKSGLGFKYHVSLANTMGIIDSDYYNNDDNGGHIMVKLVNNGKEPLTLIKGDKFCQGIFIPYGLTTDDNPLQCERTGGFGSTGR